MELEGIKYVAWCVCIRERQRATLYGREYIIVYFLLPISSVCSKSRQTDSGMDRLIYSHYTRLIKLFSEMS